METVIGVVLSALVGAAIFWSGVYAERHWCDRRRALERLTGIPGPPGPPGPMGDPGGWDETAHLEHHDRMSLGL